MALVTDTGSSAITLQPVDIVHADGTRETVYIQNGGADANKLNLRDHITLAYVIVGTIALSLSGYFTYMQIKKSKGQ